MKSVFQKIILSMMMLCAIACVASLFSVKASAITLADNNLAPDGNEYQYYVICEKPEAMDNESEKIRAYFNLPDGVYPFLGPYRGEQTEAEYDCTYLCLTDGTNIRYALSSTNSYLALGEYKYWRYNEERSQKNPNEIWGEYYYNKHGWVITKTNVPIFHSGEAGRQYYADGTADGAIYVPTVPYDPVINTHDFSKDTYDPNIQIPKLSEISYTGFTIDNPDNKQWELVIEGKVYGLKFNPKYTDPLIQTNYNYIVNRNKWNFADSPETITADGYFSIYDNLKYSTYNWFYENVKQYKETVKPIEYPNYSLLKLAYKIGWDTFLNFVKEMGLEDESNQVTGSGHRYEQYLYNTRMCQVTYYVRFVENDVEGNKHYSQWMTYTLKPSQEVFVEGEMLSKGNIEVGTVTNTNTITGSPIVSDKEYYRYNPETGEYEYYDPKTYNLRDVDWTLSLDNLQSITSVFGQFPIFVANIFSAFPSWMVQLLGATITLLCALAIYHGIRG